MTNKKQLPLIIRRYLLLVGISLGVVIGYIIGFVPKSEIFFFVILLFLVAYITKYRTDNKKLINKWLEEEK